MVDKKAKGTVAVFYRFQIVTSANLQALSASPPHFNKQRVDGATRCVFGVFVRCERCFTQHDSNLLDCNVDLMLAALWLPKVSLKSQGYTEGCSGSGSIVIR